MDFETLLVIFMLHTCCFVTQGSQHSTRGVDQRSVPKIRHNHGDLLVRRYRELARSTPGENILTTINTKNGGHKTDEGNSLLPTFDNAHKPIFTTCNAYRPEVYENQPINTPVIQVNAIDLDPENAGGRITYSIVETSDDFTVENGTGWLRTNKNFDRDEPNREKVAYVSVRATDNGQPQLDDVCNLKVHIRDINDNRPMFDKFEYRESIPRDYAPGAIVMRISATDIDDGINGTVRYSLDPHVNSIEDIQYFNVSADTGEVRLVKNIPERVYIVVGVASDGGNPPQVSTTNLSIRVIEPNQMPPTFLEEYIEPIKIKELSHNRLSPIAELEANSGIANSSLVFFELLTGHTQATNKDSTFTSEPNGNKVLIRVEKQLDYELVNHYILTMRVVNKNGLAATTVIRIEVEDENDERPFFSDVKQGSVHENENPGTFVMRIQAIDRDDTSPNNLVSYSLGSDFVDDFSIDAQTGDIRTRRPFDREAQDVFQLEVFAKDGAPSAILSPNPLGLPNERREQIKIEITDKNDNAPKFQEPRGGYKAEILENADVGTVVIEVRATDPDTDSRISYSIEAGDDEGHFSIKTTAEHGIVSIVKNMDYEKVKSYQLTVKATDSTHEVLTTIEVTVTNVNDNPPVFEDFDKSVTIQEETIPDYCIFNISAYDPDIEDRTQEQGIYYAVDKKVRESFSVHPTTGCVRVLKKFDRDLPYGAPFHQAWVIAYDEYGNTSTKHYRIIELIVNLTDVNDNHPILNSTNPVIWNENQGAGTVTNLTALDHDDDHNSHPFIFRIAEDADDEIHNTFQIEGNALRAIRSDIDREARKVYKIPIEITDSGFPPQNGTSILVVHIGDINDNPMGDGESQIVIYKYKEKNPFSIGRVFVNDLDDWDLPDKTFEWDGPSNAHFVLNYADGGISMRPTVLDGVYPLSFRVTDHARNEEAKATVTVTVKQITDEAIDKSGSIRFRGVTQEEFISREKDGEKSKQEILRIEIARIFNLPEANVDVFTVLNPDSVNDKNVVDVRFTAHGSPIYMAEKMEGLITPEQDKLEKLLNVKIDMVGVDECIQENLFCENSCFNELTKSDAQYRIVTNTSSFVGITAFISAECKCKSQTRPTSCQPNPCLNDGICHAGPNIDGFRCECSAGFEGSRCESTYISFQGEGYAWYPPLSVCSDTYLQLTFSTFSPNGLILYNGPTHKASNNVSDFVSLELKNGQPVFLLDYGSGVLRLNLTSKWLSDGEDHLVTLAWNPLEISMTLDACFEKSESCFTKGTKIGSHSSLNVNGPLQLGGISFDPKTIQEYKNWDHVPSTDGFIGCISNLTLNGEFYDLGHPSFAKGNVTNCDVPLLVGIQIATVAVGLNFMIIIFACFLILLLLIIFLIFYRSKNRYEKVKGEPGDEVRENIINYSDEGGGEGDHAGYDLSVLMRPRSTPSYIASPSDPTTPKLNYPLAPETDWPAFLNGIKDTADQDPTMLSPDDARNYAYEGDGTSIGSLSSLASGTDDEDTDFDFLPSLGPPFNKLADMYCGDTEEPDDRRQPKPAFKR